LRKDSENQDLILANLHEEVGALEDDVYRLQDRKKLLEAKLLKK